MSNICAPLLTNIWNDENGNQNQFPDKLKLADVTSAFKKIVLYSNTIGRLVFYP